MTCKFIIHIYLRKIKFYFELDLWNICLCVLSEYSALQRNYIPNIRYSAIRPNHVTAHIHISNWMVEMFYSTEERFWFAPFIKIFHFPICPLRLKVTIFFLETIFNIQYKFNYFIQRSINNCRTQVNRIIWTYSVLNTQI